MNALTAAEARKPATVVSFEIFVFIFLSVPKI
jgi:hypothetical protein